MDAATLDFISKIVIIVMIGYQLYKIKKQDTEFKKQFEESNALNAEFKKQFEESNALNAEFKKQFVQNKMLLLINELRFRDSNKEQHPYSMYDYMEREKEVLKSVMHKEYPKMSGEDIDAEINLYYNKYQPKLEDIQVNVV